MFNQNIFLGWDVVILHTEKHDAVVKLAILPKYSVWNLNQNMLHLIVFEYPHCLGVMQNKLLHPSFEINLATHTLLILMSLLAFSKIDGMILKYLLKHETWTIGPPLVICHE